MLHLTDKVSIHAPWEGCDAIDLGVMSAIIVSIHAPWEGCDRQGEAKCRLRLGFQFTHPGKGATPSWDASSVTSDSFNSRTLGRVRLVQIYLISVAVMFQFTHPGKGATLA